MPRALTRLALLPLGLVLAPCASPLDLCVPSEGRAGFFARGDCVAADSSVFEGHEWLTSLANDELAPDLRLAPDDLRLVIEGDRRQDWPKELLVRLNVGFTAYIDAALEYTSDPAIQVEHFLLDDRNTKEDAAAGAAERLRSWTREAVEIAAVDRTRALTLVGKGAHLVQDAFSTAHTRRDPATGCIENIKAFVRRAPGYFTPDIELHGPEPGSDRGHSTPEDSILTGEPGCREPSDRDTIVRCLRPSAREAIVATSEYLAVFAEGAAERAWTEGAEARLDAFIARRLSLCPPR